MDRLRKLSGMIDSPHRLGEHAGWSFAVRAGVLLIALLGVCLLTGVPDAVGKTPETGPKVAPKLAVVYPRPKQDIGPVDSTFIIGSVTPGSKLTINGTKVPVYRTGGFLAFLPVRPGKFAFRLKASNVHGTDTLTVPITIADTWLIPFDSGAIIRRETLRPSWNRTVRAGDEVSIAFDGTIGCAATFRVIALPDTLGPFPMTELQSESLRNFAAFRRTAQLREDSLPDAALAPVTRGRYHGIWLVPNGLRSDTIRIQVELKRDASANRSGKPLRGDSVAVAVAPGGLVAVDSLPPRVVELIDSVQILRMGPRLGYWSIFQPYGVRARWWGEAGIWTILQPAPGIEAWVETAKTRLLPEGSPMPFSSIERLVTRAESASVRLEVSLSDRLPFKVTINDDLNHVHIQLFGATSNTDWVTQDSTDDMISNLVWSQFQPGVYEIDLTLKHPLWGYDAHYEDKEFVLNLRRQPVIKSGVKGLTIVVDPGHSADPGAIGPTGLKEKDANLRLALALKAQLAKRGARVVMTRTGDEDVPLYNRPAIAVAHHADLYVSVHNNAVPDGTNPYANNGSAVYYYHPFSRDLARSVHKRLLQATRLNDYGLNQGNFAVIRPTQYPSILNECLFIIIPEQEEMLGQRAFVTRTAKGIADGIADFLRERQALTGSVSPSPRRR
ncbi:MAG: N-acetylmuramoyl-L-alanine amidase [candidate division Zixibacteria bacterium]|nr:N-acetylmuramoyl-L-alanine amidase [candidate division Zixibacteria bacterium]